MKRHYECKTLVDELYTQEMVRDSDRHIAGYLNDGWEIADIHVYDYGKKRITTLTKVTLHKERKH